MNSQPNGPHFDMSSPFLERERAEERFETAESLRERFGEAAEFCDACGWAMRKRDELTGKLICDVWDCPIGQHVHVFRDFDDEEAA